MSLEQSIEKLAEAIKYLADSGKPVFGTKLHENMVQTAIAKISEEIDIAEAEVDAGVETKNIEPIKKDKPKKEKKTPVTFKEVRDLVFEFVSTKAKEIKELNQKHNIKRLSQLLSDPEDHSSPVVDQEKLENFYEDLQKLKE